MTRRLLSFWRDESGAPALEFALIAPALVMIVVGIAQLGVLFMANAGLRNAVAEGARLATIHPRPNDATIQARIAASEFGLNPANLTTPTITPGTSDNANYLDISATYSVQLDFLFYTPDPITLTETRRVFVHAV